MLLRGLRDDAVVCIGQPAHAWVSGQLARAWRGVEPREDVCLAAAQHDIGMAAWDAEPELNPSTGRPYGFTEMPLETHVRLWRRAPALALAQGRYVALLVSMHGSALYEMRDLDQMADAEASAVRAYLDGQRALQRALRASLGVGQEEAGRNQRLLWTWDFLSLALCLAWAPTGIDDAPIGEGRAERLELRAGGGAFTIEPWPFAPDRVALRCDGRVLRGRFEDEERMRAALDDAPWVTLEWLLQSRLP
ncbi:MAG: DUF3891 family protein [Solirubrobacteraceae bacterium]